MSESQYFNSSSSENYLDSSSTMPMDKTVLSEPPSYFPPESSTGYDPGFSYSPGMSVTPGAMAATVRADRQATRPNYLLMVLSTLTVLSLLVLGASTYYYFANRPANAQAAESKGAAHAHSLKIEDDAATPTPKNSLPTQTPTVVPPPSATPANHMPDSPQVTDRFFQIGSRTIGCEEKNGTFGCTMDVSGSNQYACGKGWGSFSIAGTTLNGPDCSTKFFGKVGDVVPFVSAQRYFLSSSGRYACKIVTDSRVQCWSTQNGKGFDIGNGNYSAYQH